MGRKSTKEKKNIYQTSREALGLTREQAAERMETVSEDRIEKIEGDRSLPHPDEILELAQAYENPHLTNYYCSHECPIGRKYVPEAPERDLSQLTLGILANLNALEERKNRFIDISADGEISPDEMPDFAEIRERLEDISVAVNSLRLWVEKTIGG